MINIDKLKLERWVNFGMLLLLITSLYSAYQIFILNYDDKYFTYLLVLASFGLVYSFGYFLCYFIMKHLIFEEEY